MEILKKTHNELINMFLVGSENHLETKFVYIE